MAAYLTFLLDLGGIADNRLVQDTLSFVPDPKRRPKTAFVWKVTCDARGRVVVRGHHDGGYGVIATAQWGGTLDDRKQRGTTPTEFQWDLVQTAMEKASALRKADPSPYDDSLVEDLSPAEERSLESPSRALPSTILHEKTGDARPSRAERLRDEQPRGRRLAVLIVTLPPVLVVVAILVVRCTSTSPVRQSPPAPAVVATPEPPVLPPPPPPPSPPPGPATLDEVIAATPDLDHATLAGYRIRWSDVDVPSETTLAKVEKDPSAEKGKRVCAEGTLERITKTDVGGRTHYAGSLITGEGDRVVFLVGGSTGELLKRDAARLCGVVTGTVDGSTQLFGMFDLPENRNPVVEAP
ncbi:MAG: hypothetical protein AB7T06_08840 [Kofleriaceae bacterium]